MLIPDDNLNAVDGVDNGDTIDGGPGRGDICTADAGETKTACEA